MTNILGTIEACALISSAGKIEEQEQEVTKRPQKSKIISTKTIWTNGSNQGPLKKIQFKLDLA